MNQKTPPADIESLARAGARYWTGAMELRLSAIRTDPPRYALRGADYPMVTVSVEGDAAGIADYLNATRPAPLFVTQ